MKILHKNAHGAGIKASKLPSFLKYANEKLSKEAFENCYLIDYLFEANESELKDVGIKIAEHDEYFGNGIPEVKIIVKNIPLSNILVMGADKSSIKISYNGVDYIKFKDFDFIQDIQENRTKNLTIYGRLNLNCFAGKTSLQVFIDDYEFEKEQSKYDF